MTEPSPEILAALHSLTSEHDLEQFLLENSAFDASQLWHQLASMGALDDPLTRPLMMRLALVGSAVRTSPAIAWEEYRQLYELEIQLRSALEQAHGEISRAYHAESYDEVLGRVGAIIRQAHLAGEILAMIDLLWMEGRSAMFTRTGSRAQNLERAGRAFDTALGLATASEQREQRTMLALDLAWMMVERIRGESLDDLAFAEKLLRSAINSTSADEQKLLALLKTNLATVMLRAVGRIPNQPDATLAKITAEAVDLCKWSLEVRKFSSDPIGWAYSTIVLFDALVSDSDVSGKAIDPPFWLLESVIAAESEVLDKDVVVEAHVKLADWKVRRARASARTASTSNTPSSSLPVDIEINNTAEVLTGALAIEPISVQTRARILTSLAVINADNGNDDLAFSFAESALNYLTPTNNPSDCRRVSGIVFQTLAGRGEWQKCADIGSLLIQSSELLLHSRRRQTSRVDEMHAAGNSYRWSAFAFAKCGMLAEAAATLEKGRARELRLRFSHASSLAEIDEIPEALKDEYEAALVAFRTSAFDTAGEYELRRLHEAIAGIRSLEGFEDFGMDLDLSVFGRATVDGWPLVYVDPTPWGTILLFVSNAPGYLAFESVILDGPTSGDIFALLCFGHTTPPTDISDVGSYLLGPGTGSESGIGFNAVVHSVFEYLGEEIAKPLAISLGVLTGDGPEGLTLVVCGPLASAPLHACAWEADGTRKCLLDFLPVRFATSAGAIAYSIKRVQELEGQGPDSDHPVVLIGGVDKKGSAGGAELDHIACTYGASVIGGSDFEAESSLLRSSAPASWLLHIAAHARAERFGRLAPVVEMADGPYALGTSEGLALSCRLVVLSACETAVWRFSDPVDEYHSMAVSMIGLGSASVVASLWEVNSTATTLLMVRFHEILHSGMTPAAALRSSQLWLRDLRFEGLEEFLRRHPGLDSQLTGTASAPVQTQRSPVNGPKTLQIFHDVDYWGGFAVYGA